MLIRGVRLHTGAPCAPARGAAAALSAAHQQLAAWQSSRRGRSRIHIKVLQRALVEQRDRRTKRRRAATR